MAVGSSLFAILAALVLASFSQEEDFFKFDSVGGEPVAEVPGTVSINITVR